MDIAHQHYLFHKVQLMRLTLTILIVATIAQEIPTTAQTLVNHNLEDSQSSLQHRLTCDPRGLTSADLLTRLPEDYELSFDSRPVRCASLNTPINI